MMFIMFHLSPCFVVILSFFSYYSLLVDATQEIQAHRRTQSTSSANISCNADTDCPYANQKCALSSAEASATRICCQSTVFFAYEPPFDPIDESEYNRLDLDDEGEESEAPTPTPWYRTYAHLINQSMCADQPPGALCVYSNDLCASGVCGADEICQEGQLPTLASCSDDADCDSGACGAPTVRDIGTSYRVCCPSGRAVFKVCADQPAGAECGRKNSLCASNNCDNGVCMADPLHNGSGNGGHCNYDSECTTNVCIQGKCQPRRSAAGGPCDTDSDCFNGKCGLELAFARSRMICCPSGDHGYGGDLMAGRNVCSEQEDGMICGNNPNICKGGYCNDGICSSVAPPPSIHIPVPPPKPIPEPVATQNSAATVSILSRPQASETVAGHDSPTMEPTWSPTNEPTTEPDELIGPITMLGLRVKMLGVLNLSSDSIYTFEKSYERHCLNTFDGRTGNQEMRSIHDFSTKVTFVSQSRSIDGSLFIDFIQQLSFRSGIEVDVERIMNAPLKNRMRRKEFCDELKRSRDPLFTILDGAEAVSSLIQVDPSVATNAKESGIQDGREGEKEDQRTSVDWTFEVKSGVRRAQILGALFIATFGLATATYLAMYLGS